MNTYLEGEFARMVGASEVVEDWFANEDGSSKGSPNKSKSPLLKLNNTNQTTLNNITHVNENRKAAVI